MCGQCGSRTSRVPSTRVPSPPRPGPTCKTEECRAEGEHSQCTHVGVCEACARSTDHSPIPTTARTAVRRIKFLCAGLCTTLNFFKRLADRLHRRRPGNFHRLGRAQSTTEDERALEQGQHREG